MRRYRAAAAALLLALAGTACSRAPDPPPTPDEGAGLIIRDARLIDGTGAPARPADVRIRGSRITAIGRLDPVPGETVVDAAGRVLAPGFIDTHSHHDRGLLDEPDALGAVSQGITTIVVGNDGSSHVPLADFFAEVERAGTAVNVASYAGHGTLRAIVMGDDVRRHATPAEQDSMAALLRRELGAGALGLSTGLEYDPGLWSDTGEVIALARVAADSGGRYISHMRSEDRTLWAAVDETVRIGREARLPVQISHIKLAMRSLWGSADSLVAVLDAARASGVDVTADIYPYTYWQSTMTVLFPERDLTDRAVAEFALRELVPPEGMRIARYEADTTLQGRTLAQVAADRGESSVTTLLALIERAEAEDAAESIIATSMTDADVARLLTWPHSNIASDGALRGGHPRGFGAFTRVVGPMVRSDVLPLEDAVRKMTSLSARHTGLADRGVVREGAFADLVLFDPATVADRATPEDPHAQSVGILAVWVNGTLVYEDGRTTGARPGTVVRRTTGPER